MKVNYVYGTDIEAGNLVNLASTTTTSITIITDITSTSYAASTSLTVTKQTLYFSKGIIQDLGASSSTRVAILA